MTIDYMVMLPNRPGVLANLSTTIGKAGITIEGISGTQYQDKVVLHLLFDKGNEASVILRKHKFTIMSTREVLVVEIVDKPGELGRITQKLANADVNIDFLYLATKSRLVLGVDDPVAAIVALD